MNSGQEAMLLACAGGALGGIASYLHLVFGGFKAIPTAAPLQVAGVTAQRILFLFGRVIFGLVCAFIFSFWFMEDYESGSLHKSKLAFISALIGFSTTVLAAASSKLGKLLG